MNVETGAVAVGLEQPKSGVEETRLRILTAARKIYAEKGSRGTTTREVADRAGVNEATLFRHFGTKGQLINAMLEQFSEIDVLAAIVEKVRTTPGLEAQLNLLGTTAVESLRRKEDLIRVGMAEELVNPQGCSSAWRAPNAARRMLAGFMREKIAGGELSGDPESLARVFMSMFFAYTLATRLWADDEHTTEAAVALIVGIFLNGARPR